MVAVPLALATAVCAAGAVSAAPVPTVHPAQGGVYYGLRAGAQYADDPPMREDVTAVLRVSRDGRRLVAARLQLSCSSRQGGFNEQMRLSFHGDRDATIRRDGSFQVSRKGQRRRFSLAGRFVSPQFARLSFRAAIPRLVDRDYGRSVCRAEGGDSPSALYLNGVPPFSGCDTQRAYTLLSTDTGRIFRQQFKPPERGWGYAPHVYGCLFASPSNRFDLGENVPPDTTLESFRLAGPFVAFFRGGCIGACVGLGQRSIEVRDLRDGSLASKPAIPAGARLWDLVVSSSGSVAWTLDRFQVGDFGQPLEPPVVVARELWANDSHGLRLIDSGPELVLDSLELQGSTIYWLNGTGARSATLD